LETNNLTAARLLSLQCRYWEPNSRVVHATAVSFEGPYTKKGVVTAPFAHEPNAVRSPEGDWVIYMTMRHPAGGSYNCTSKGSGTASSNGVGTSHRPWTRTHARGGGGGHGSGYNSAWSHRNAAATAVATLDGGGGGGGGGDSDGVGDGGGGGDGATGGGGFQNNGGKNSLPEPRHTYMTYSKTPDGPWSNPVLVLKANYSIWDNNTVRKWLSLFFLVRSFCLKGKEEEAAPPLFNLNIPLAATFLTSVNNPLPTLNIVGVLNGFRWVGVSCNVSGAD
jgi:hypothetical protein